ncbi:MAG: hypothetical protein H3Z52_05295 [archaeon]|nr:hypothetical protein [archaeon]
MLACPVCKSEKITLNQNLNTKGSPPHTVYLQAKCEKCGQVLVVEFTPTKVQAQYIE